MRPRVRAIRVELGISQAELARRIKMSQGALSHIENGTRKPSLDAALRISRVLKKTSEELFGELFDGGCKSDCR